jgi:hypothetical protein
MDRLDVKICPDCGSDDITHKMWISWCNKCEWTWNEPQLVIPVVRVKDGDT